MPRPARQVDSIGSMWRSYARRFRIAAKAAGHDAEYVGRCLAYARGLVDRGLPVIYDQFHFAALVGVELDYLLRASNAPAKFYRHFEIAKRSGKTREIAEPLPTLKRVQRWILKEILSKGNPSRFAHAFGPGCSIRSNARFHVKQQVLVAVDIKDFFPSIKRRVVYRVFRDLGYAKAVSGLLAGLTTLNESLPQGAPTSPSISNLVCRELDARMAGFCMPRKWRYTRYADDLAFSGDVDAPVLIRFVRKVMAEYGFELRDEKTRVMRRQQRQVITGVVVNEATKASRKLRRDLRQQSHYIARHGLADHMERKQIVFANYSAHLLGQANFVRFLDSNDRDASELIRVLLSQGE